MPDQLDRYLAEARNKAFVWGQDDCLQFVALWGEWLGVRDAGRWRGKCFDEPGAKRFLNDNGGAVAVFVETFGPPRIGSAAQRGDIGLLEVEGWHLGMICTGRMWVMRAGERGVRFVRKQADIVWSMGLE